MDITPKDQVETKALGIGQRITVALGIVVAALSSLLAAVGGLDWIIANLPLLGTGISSLITGGVISYVAVRRMRVDKLAGKAGLLLLLLLPLLTLTGCICRQAWLRLVMLLLLPALLLSGCAAVYTPKLSAISWGIDSSQVLSGLNVSRSSSGTNDSYEVILDASTGQQTSSKVIDGLITLGEIVARAKGIPVDSSSAAAPAAAPDAAESDPAPAEETAAIAYSADGYNGTPGAAGEGVYGRPSCARCRAYRAAHPDVPVINLDEGTHRADMWAALRLRGYAGGSAALPVLITADAYTLSAK